MLFFSFCLSLVFGVAAFICMYYKVFPFFFNSSLAFWTIAGIFFFGMFLVSFNKFMRFFGYWLEAIRHEEKERKKR